MFKRIIYIKRTPCVYVIATMIVHEMCCNRTWFHVVSAVVLLLVKLHEKYFYFESYKQNGFLSWILTNILALYWE